MIWSRAKFMGTSASPHLILCREAGKFPATDQLDDFDFVRFDTLAALTEFELDLLARNESAAPGAFDVGEVNEHILLALARDESETLLVIEELDGTGWHDYSFLFCYWHIE